LEEAEWVQTRYDQLSFIDEKRLAAVCHGQLYRKRMKKAFDKKIHLRMFCEGDLVVKKSYQFKKIIAVNGCLTMKVHMW